ncbi:hypothetical protein [Streptomyces sp. NPDC050538]|uniref:hypothetical protein n=1 Tax=Streptomyces sp. NPDC050538 TaxID=3365627 RepID=UPI0037B153A8
MDTSWLGVAGAAVGAAVAGIVGVVQAQVQRRSQAEALDRQAAYQDRSEELKFALARWQWHADLRRQSYIDCLITAEKYSRFGRVFEEISASLVEGAPEPILPAADGEDLASFVTRFRSQYVEAFDLTQVVRLVGPPAVAHQAHRLIRGMGTYFDLAENLARDAQHQRRRSLSEHEQLREVFRAFRRELSSFLEGASVDLTQVPPPSRTLPG